jgi:glutathione S-transferase
MIELIQFPWSPYCIVTRRILEYAGAPFKIIDIPSTDRSLVWKVTRQRYYSVPVIRDGGRTVFEVDHDSQVIAKYLDGRLGLGLFPRGLDGLQSLLWPYIENEIEGMTFRLNDAHYREFVPNHEQLDYLRYKERKFGSGCLDQWLASKRELTNQLTRLLMPCEEMLYHRDFLLDDRPRFVDFDLFGMLGNLLFTRHNKLPSSHDRLRGWYNRMAQLKPKSHPL